jgi:hypothetical protein
MGIFNRSKTGKTPFACSLPPFTTINAAAGLLFQKNVISFANLILPGIIGGRRLK